MGKDILKEISKLSSIMLNKDTLDQISKLAIEAITGQTNAKKPFEERANQAVRKLIRGVVTDYDYLGTRNFNAAKCKTAAAAIFNAAVDFELGPNTWVETAPGRLTAVPTRKPKPQKAPAKKPAAQKKAKAGTELDLFRKAAAKAEKAAQKNAPLPGTGKVKTKKTGKAVKRAAAILIGAAALIFSAGIAAAQCPGGNCQRAGYYSGTAYGAYFTPWGGWYWPGGYFYGYQPKVQQTAPVEPETVPEPAADQQTQPEEPENAAPEPEDPEPPRIEIGICPMAAIAADLVNKARTDRGLPPLVIDGELSAACERHAAYMKARGFGHDPNGGRECIAEGYSTPAAAVSAWMNSDGHRAIILGAGTRLGIGVVGRYYTLRIR